MHRNEHRTKPRGLADLLLPYALVEDGILLQQDGSLLTGWSYRGPDMMSAAPAEMDTLSARLNSPLRLGSGWMVQCDAIRSRAPGYPEPPTQGRRERTFGNRARAFLAGASRRFDRIRNGFGKIPLPSDAAPHQAAPRI